MKSDPRSQPETSDPNSSVLTIGTRGSALALQQAGFATDRLAAVRPDLDVQVQVITSVGDIDKESPLTKIGGRGVFTSSLQRALTLREIDAAVHSSKDVPSISATGLILAAFPQREDPRDVVVSRHGVGLAELPPNPVVGTSSRRRAVQVLALRPDARIIELRGNIDTRLKKAMAEPYDAVILAAAGLARMGWLDRATELLPVEVFTPAPGQGALAIETREAPDPAVELIRAIDDARVRQVLEIERAFLRGIGGGCTTPLGAHAVIETLHGRRIARFFGMLARDDGEGLERIYEEWPVERATEAAFEAAGAMIREVHPNRVFGAGAEVARQLRGMRVIITGTADLSKRAATEVERRGGQPVFLQTIEILPPVDPNPLHKALTELKAGGFDHLVLTSRQGVEALSEALSGLPTGAVKVAAIGEATAAAMRQHGVEPHVVAEDSRGKGMLAALDPYIQPCERVLLPISNRARRVIAEGLAERGAEVVRVDAYETRVVTEPAADVLALVKKGEVGAVLLASPSAVEGFVAQFGTVLPVLSGATFVAIGPMTAKVMEENGLPVHVMAKQPGAEAMVSVLAEGLWGSDLA